MADRFLIYVSGYGSWAEDFASRIEAEDRAIEKATWEGARTWLVWRADLSTEFDRLTAQLASLWLSGTGADQKLMRQRAEAKAALPASPTVGGE